MYLTTKIFNPEIYQGKYKNHHYFEGWYFKMVDKRQHHILSIIPGISKGNALNKNHAFIQIINGIKGETFYISYAMDKFQYSIKNFHIEIGENKFTSTKIVLNIKHPDIEISGTLNFTHIIGYPKNLLHPGIMGYYSFIPFMECYHGVINIHHEIIGSLMINHAPIDFTGGYGYIEKDWGTSFPESWIWVQCNHFHPRKVSFMFSIAKIPWFFTSFLGFISFLRIGDEYHTFATYTGAKITKLQYNNGALEVILENKGYALSFRTALSQIQGELTAPVLGMMDRKIKESINSTILLNLQTKNNHCVFYGTGFNTGIEFAGNTKQFIV
ncbi:MAG: tocopherol cyclase family protein [Eubacteriales bacterium]